MNHSTRLGIFSTALLAIPGLAQAEEAAASGGAFAQLVPLILIMVVFYFLLIRPQQKRIKEHKNMVAELKKGDRVVTGGGILGKVVEAKDDILKIEIANGVQVEAKRDTVVNRIDTQ